jgi:mannose-6-phosphate isomerase-like protein (cupin superfamily)
MKVITIKDIETTNAYFNPKIKKHVVLSDGELDNIYSFALAVIPPNEVSRAHAHENMSEVFFVQSGTGIIRINNKDFELTEGMCAVVEANETHEIENTGEADLKIIYFEITTKAGAE